MRISRRAVRWIAVAGVLAIAIAGGSAVLWRTPPAALPAPPHFVALPCNTSAAGTDARAFCDGLTEAVVSKLARLTRSHRLQVTPHVGGVNRTILTTDDARRQLGATWVLQAGVQPVGDGYRVNYTITVPRTRFAHAAQMFELDVRELFEAHERILAWVVRALSLELTHPQRESLMVHDTRNAHAQWAFFAGRGHLLRARDPTLADAAVDAFDRAIANDVMFAAAHAALGMAWRARYLRTRDADSLDRARRACAESVRLQPKLAEGHTCLGMLSHATGDYAAAAAALMRAVDADPTNDDALVWLGRAQEDLRSSSEAEKTYVRAVEDRPHYAIARTWLGTFYHRQARYEDAARAFARAAELLPESARWRAAAASPLIYIGRYDEAIAGLKESVAIEPTREALVAWGMTLFRMRRFDEAAATIERARPLGPPDHTMLGGLARAYYWRGTDETRAQAIALYQEAIQLVERALAQPSFTLSKADSHLAAAEFYAKAGRSDDARASLQQVGLSVDDTLRPTDPHQLFFAALVYAQLGDRDTALKLLERAVYWGVPSSELRAWPELDTLRNDRVFRELAKSD